MDGQGGEFKTIISRKEHLKKQVEWQSQQQKESREDF
jgi:hypothetical protein